MKQSLRWREIEAHFFASSDLSRKGKRQFWLIFYVLLCSGIFRSNVLDNEINNLVCQQERKGKIVSSTQPDSTAVFFCFCILQRIIVSNPYRSTRVACIHLDNSIWALLLSVISCSLHNIMMYLFAIVLACFCHPAPSNQFKSRYFSREFRRRFVPSSK